jgi:Cu+-exporting ATPase
MHPDVLTDGEGRCPECGMHLTERPGDPHELHQVYGVQAGVGEYTCPMHPEVVSGEPGRCPKCGMFLEQVPADGGSTTEESP